MATGHVDNLDGSAHAKLRLKVFLDTLSGSRTVPDACWELNICESRLHALRRRWLQESLELLEPQLPGRRPAEAEDPRVAELQAVIADLQRQLSASGVEQEVERILCGVPAATVPEKKPGIPSTTVMRGGNRRRPR